jgi:predicted Rossmann fold flavoprotein
MAMGLARRMQESFDLAVVGGGASGLVAAISAARRGASVAVLERLPRIGKKLLATGGGRCNLLNDGLSSSAFTSTDPGLVSSVLDRFGRADIRAFFEGLGLKLQADDAGRVYPATNQAASVVKIIELEASRLGVVLETGFDVERIERPDRRFRIGSTGGRKVEAGAVILAGGGRSYPALGSNGSCYGLAASFGHSIVRPVPSAVPLLVKDRLCHLLQGQRTRVSVVSRVGGRPGQRSEGELLFTQYGLSGTAALDVSESLSIALNRDGRNDASIVVDLLPFLNSGDAAAEFSRRLATGWAPKDLISGLLPEKFSLVMPQFLSEAGIVTGKGDVEETAYKLAAALKAREFPVQGTRGWNEAEFTSGGVDAREMKLGTLESKLRRGLYFAGEGLDVQGARGGFNLAWAWASGFVAGLAD